jgi:regulator of RNase E activity RraB
MDVDITSDNLKAQIIDYKKRDQLGLIEKYDTSMLK